MDKESLYGSIDNVKCFISGRKGHPPSPYSFDKPGIESSIRQALDNESDVSRIGKPPKWVQHINERICKHSGEAPMFSESLLSSKKVILLKLYLQYN